MRGVQLPAPAGLQRSAPIDLADELRKLRLTLEHGLSGPGLSDGAIGKVRAVLNSYYKATGRWPGFLDIGISPFYDVYDWHVRRQQPIRIIRLAEQRFGIQFMFTQLIVRWEVPDPNYVGVPY